MDEVVPFDCLAIGQGKDIGLFTLHEHGALMLIANMLHKLRVAKPTIGNHYGRRQRQATPCKRRQTLVEHHSGPAQFVPARRPRPYRIRPSNGKVHWDDQATIANDHQK